MNDSQNPRKARPGPIGFHAESKVTRQNRGPSSNVGGIGEARITRETRTKSKELKTIGIGPIVVIGIAVALLGIVLLSPLLAIVGVLIVVAGFATKARNQTENRLRNEWEEESD